MTEGKLTRNQALVLAALAEAKSPMSAYDILDRVRADGMRSPLQVYRALGPLVERGHAHRLESLSAFVACAHEAGGHAGGHGEGHHHAPIAFAICDACGRVDEFPDALIGERLAAWAGEHGFRAAKTTIEMRGTCGACLAVE